MPNFENPLCFPICLKKKKSHCLVFKFRRLFSSHVFSRTFIIFLTDVFSVTVVSSTIPRFALIGDFRDLPKKMQLFLKDIVPAAQNNINTRFIILDKARSATTTAANGKNCIALAADETAAVHIQLWGDECDAFEAGDIVRLTNGIFSYVRNSGLVLRAGKRGKMEKMGEFTVAFVETPNVSEIQWNPDPENPKRYIQNAVVSAYSRIFPPLP